MRASIVLGAALVAVAPAAAHAGGIEFPDNGALAVGQGGAIAAKPEDGMALAQNPAGLAYQHGLRLTADANSTNMALSFTPAGGGPKSTVHNTAGAFLAPGGVVSYGWDKLGPLKGFTFALGAVGPSAIGKLSYPANGAQRYELISSDYFIAYYSLAVAAKINKYFGFGVTFQLAQGTAKFSQAAWSGFGQGTDPTYDTIATVDVKSGVIPTAVIGATVTPTEKWAFGISYRPRFTFHGDGTLKSAPPASAQGLGVTQEGDSASLDLNFPDVVRVGAQFKPHQRVALEGDFVWEGWSVMKSINVTPHNIKIDSSAFGTSQELPPIVLPQNFTDVFSVRLGGNVTVVPDRLWLRAGYLFETSGIPNDYVTVSFGNWGRHALSVGGSLALFGGVDLDFAYAHHFVPTQTVTNSQVQQVVTPSPFPEGSGVAPSQPSKIGNGVYTASFDVFSFGLRIAFDALTRHP